MPSGFERLNVRRRAPNANITFITPLPTSDAHIAQDFLERVAAIVFPIMRAQHLHVTSLVEFPANREFWGRNFNAGEKIELVLKNPNTGHWLPFSFVQAVMIHELSHNKHMDHAAGFWRTKGVFDRELAALKAKGYTGEGFWSAGRTLVSEALTRERPLAEADMPANLCGGTYRERRKRVAKPKLSSAEQKKRRIEKKFGVAGQKVGAEEEVGKKGKPRVAQSKRGRELRAEAALRRLEGKKEEPEEEDPEKEEEEDDWSEGDEEKGVDVGGRFLVPVSGECDGAEAEEQKGRELRELLSGCATGGEVHAMQEPGGESSDATPPKQRVWLELSDTEDEVEQKKPPGMDTKCSVTKPPNPKEGQKKAKPPSSKRPHEPTSKPGAPDKPSSTCLVCTTENRPGDTVCMTCANVLSPHARAKAWKCGNLDCPPEYANIGDVRYCGICERARP